MSDAHEAVKRKFALFGQPATKPPPVPPAQPAPPLQTASAGKGPRRRLTLRLSDPTVAGLKVLRVVLGRDVNSLCEEFIAKGLAEKLDELEVRAAPGELDVIRRFTSAKRP